MVSVHPQGFLGRKTDFLAVLNCHHVSVSTGDSNQNVSDHRRLCAFKARGATESQETRTCIIKFPVHAGAPENYLQKDKWICRVTRFYVLILCVQSKKKTI